jgi:hypothetical protein
MLTITFQNISNGAATSDYEYHIYVNRREIAIGQVHGHTKKDGWQALVALLADQVSYQARAESKLAQVAKSLSDQDLQEVQNYADYLVVRSK